MPMMLLTSFPSKNILFFMKSTTPLYFFIKSMPRIRSAVNLLATITGYGMELPLILMSSQTCSLAIVVLPKTP